VPTDPNARRSQILRRILRSLFLLSHFTILFHHFYIYRCPNQSCVSFVYTLVPVVHRVRVKCLGDHSVNVVVLRQKMRHDKLATRERQGLLCDLGMQTQDALCKLRWRLSLSSFS
jgi:hypothetical protein